jgi:hypothetical protein
MASLASACPRSKPKARFFQCQFLFHQDVYLVKPVRDVHPEIAVRAYQFAKQTGARDVYHVRLTPEGHAECDCRGHQRWNHCKHVSMLVALGCLPVSCQPTKPD